jgi:RNA polymerase sigma factor (sigma-70 family)
MATDRMNTVIQHIRQTVRFQDEAAWTDAELLTHFIEHQDESAFASLVRRHGAMVMGVCLRVARNQQDAEDAFQAAFLILVRKAASIGSRELIGNWLYGVAYNTALKAKAANMKRRIREKQVTELPEPALAEESWNDDLKVLIDQELSRLPTKYRIPILLCELEGKSRKEAAEILGCPEGSLSSRLARAKTMLAKRLARHGLAVSGGSLGAALAQNAASACVPPSIAAVTIKTATLVATGQATVGMISPKVAALIEGVLKVMLLSKLKIGAIWLVMSLLAFGAGLFIYQGATAQSGTIEQAPEGTKQTLPAPKRLPHNENVDPPKKNVIRVDEEELQGAWQLIASTEDGRDVPVDLVKQVHVKFHGGKMKFTPPLEFHEKQFEGEQKKYGEFKLGEGDFELTFHLDPTSKPKSIDLVLPDDIGKRQVIKGIYSLEGDRLRICARLGDRPTDLTCRTGSKRVLYVMERKKPVPDTKKQDASKADEEKLQGAWRVVSAERYGIPWKNVDGEFVIQDKTPMAFPISPEIPNQVVFSGRQCSQEIPQGEGMTLVVKDTFTLDAERKPKWITLAGKDGVIIYGIYSMDRDELRLCWQYGQRRNLRPTDFDTMKKIDRDDDTEVWVLKRPGPDAKKKVAQKDESKTVLIQQSWDGIIPNRNLVKESPPDGFVVEAESWAKVWKAWRSKEKLPAIDFDKQIALILTVPGPNIISAPELLIDRAGNVKVPLPVSTLLPDDGRIGYKIILINRAGVKSVNGKTIIKLPQGQFPSY